MKAGVGVGMMALGAWLTLAAPLAAQTAPATNNSAAETIGPPQLRDFNLNGTVTRPAPTPAPTTQRPAPTPKRPAPSTPQPAPQSAAEPGLPTAASQPQRPAVTGPAPSATMVPRAANGSDRVALPPTDALDRAPTPAQPSGGRFVSQPNAEPAVLPPSASMTIDEGPSLLPWLLAALLVGAAALYFALRPRLRPALAGPAGRYDDLAPEPARPLERALPAAPAPQPAPSPPPATPGLVTSTRLRPWLEVEFTPVRAVVDDQHASVEFEVDVFNSGSAPAREVLVEACMFNAGPAQDEQIRTFFTNPVGQGERIALIMPLARIALKSAVTLTREQIREFEIGGRILFVPLIGFNALYRFGGGSEGQTSTSFLVGRDGNGENEKMAPLRLDLGPRQFRGLSARPLGINVRK